MLRLPMNRFRDNRLQPFLLLSVVLLLRAAVPAGFMPAAAGSGLLFELCPEKVPAEFTRFLAGLQNLGHHDHGQMEHGAGAHDEHRCPMGQMLLSAAAVDDASPSELAPAAVVSAPIPVYSFTSASSTHYYSRGPPA